MGLIGIIIVLLIAGFGTWFMYDDFAKRFKKIYRYDINFKDNWKTCGLPLIKLKINDKLEYFLIDSGASVNMIKQSYFDLIINKPIITKDNKKLHTGSIAIKADLCNFSLSYKNAKFPDETFNIIKLETFDTLKKAYGYNIVGIIGSPFMGKYNWSMDFEDLIIWIRK